MEWLTQPWITLPKVERFDQKLSLDVRDIMQMHELKNDNNLARNHFLGDDFHFQLCVPYNDMKEIGMTYATLNNFVKSGAIWLETVFKLAGYHTDA